MPRTIKLSKQFYDRFGDEVADEMIDLFNAVDDSSRVSLFELNESNFARFDARIEKRFAEQDAKFEKRFAEQDAKFEKRFAEQDAKFEKHFAALEVMIEKRVGEQNVKLERALKDQTRWMFFAWSTLLIAIVGLAANR